MQTFGAIFSNMKFERQHTFLCGDRIAVLSKISATINEPPPGFDEFPMFAGIDPAKLKGRFIQRTNQKSKLWPNLYKFTFQLILGKYFETLALDIQVISEGKIKQSWHIEDWTTALDQALYGKPIPDFGLGDDYINY